MDEARDGLGDVLGGLGRLVGMIVDMAAKGQDESSVHRVIPLGPRARADVGWTVKMGVAGETGRREALRRRRPAVARCREPNVEVSEVEGWIRVVADLPGATEDSISYAVDGRQLSLAARGPNIEYRKVITLPLAVDPSRAAVSFRNGILDLALPVA